jgi:hypothetical protein
MPDIAQQLSVYERVMTEEPTVTVGLGGLSTLLKYLLHKLRLVRAWGFHMMW